jgi:hypothetical protein
MDQSDQTPATPAVATIPTTAVNPGHGLGIASLIVSLVGVGLVGLILGIVGLNKSKKAGHKNGLALAGIIIGAINIVVVTIVSIVLISAAVTLVNKCKDLGSGTHVENGITFTCPSSSTTYTYE